jgi:hypothetical protein
MYSGWDKQTKSRVFSVVGIDGVVYSVTGIYGINHVMILFGVFFFSFALEIDLTHFENEEFCLFRYWHLRNKPHYDFFFFIFLFIYLFIFGLCL